jgi:5'-nucleotidase
MRTITSLLLMVLLFSVFGCQRPVWEKRATAPPPPEIEVSTAPLPVSGPLVADTNNGENVQFVDSAQPAPAQPEDTFRTHTIARGETLWRIARKYYGDGAKWRMIAEYNNIPDPNKLVIGQKLTLP